MHRLARSLLGAAFAALAWTASLPVAAADYTDIWYTPVESGWGVNLVQNQDVIFATFFVYGVGLQPLWYIAVLKDDGSGVFTGEMYATAGSFFGGTWDPSQRAIATVGNVTFTPTSADTGTLAYNVGTVNVTKSIVRQTLTTIALGGAYKGALAVDQFNCSNAQNNVSTSVAADVNVGQTTSGAGQVDFVLGNNVTCSMKGTLVQRGQNFSMTGATYTCSNGLSTTANVTELHATAQGIEGKWSASVPGNCTEAGRFSAVLK